MTTIKLNLSSVSNLAVTPDWNKTGAFDPVTSSGVVISDLLDTNGESTGVSFSVVAPLASRGGSAAFADADAWGIPLVIWQEMWVFRNSTINGEVKFSGFGAGQAVNLIAAGHRNAATRDTDYIVNGGAPVRYDATAKPPAQPITITATADSNGEITISTNFVSVDSLANFFILDYEVSTSPTIDNIDQLVEGQTSTITFSAPFSPSSLTISDGAVSHVVTEFTGAGETWSFMCPAITDGEVRPKIGAVSVTASNGTETTAGYVAQYTKTGYSTILLSDVSADNYRQGTEPQLESGSQVIFPSAMSINAAGIHSGNTAGEYLVYDISPVDRIVRSFTLTYVPVGEDVPPVMPPNRTVTVYEGATTLGTFPAISGTQPISYALGGVDAALFTVNTATAKVDPVGTLTDGQSGAITVTASNSEGSDSQTITFTVVAIPGTTQGAMETARMEVIKMESISMRVINMEVLK